MSEEYIQFVANYGEWKSVKKLKIEGKTDPRTILEFLASLNTSLDKKMEANLARLVDVPALIKAIDEELAGVGKGEAGVAKALAAIAGTRLGKTINAICEKPEWQKGEQDEIKGFCRAFAARRALSAANVMVDYSQVEIPGMKRLMKKNG